VRWNDKQLRELASYDTPPTPTCTCLVPDAAGDCIHDLYPPTVALWAGDTPQRVSITDDVLRGLTIFCAPYREVGRPGTAPVVQRVGSPL